MKKIILMCCLLVGGVCAGIVERTNSKPVLVGRVELASFDEISRKAMTLGGMIQNPIVPSLLTSGMQSALTEQFGAFRSDAPFAWYFYLQMPAFQIAATNDDLVAVSDLWDAVMVYPCRESATAMKQSHPGAMLEADGTLHLLAGEKCPDDRWVKFSCDGKFCAFAKSAALAARALEDFAARPKTAATRPLAMLEIPQSGLDALVTCMDGMTTLKGDDAEALKNLVGAELNEKLQKLQVLQRARQKAELATLAGAMATLDLDDSGFLGEAKLLPKPGTTLPVMAGLGLPSDALATVPPDAPLFVAQYDLLNNVDEKEFRAVLDLIAEAVDAGAKAAEKSRNAACRKYAPFLKDIAGGLQDLACELPFPSVTDWTAAALAFDAAHHPWVGIALEDKERAKAEKAGRKLWRRLLAAVERQWPERKMLVEVSPEESIVNWGAVIDVVADETGTGKDEKSARALRIAKKNVAAFLGDVKTRLVGKDNGTRTMGFIASPGVSPRTGASNAEARLAAALPDVAAQRPGGVAYFSLYALLRDEALPIAEKFVDAETLEQIQQFTTVLPEAQPNSAIACAVWFGKDGVRRVQGRVTANEIRNFGAAFNACTGAALNQSSKKKGKPAAR